MAEEKKVDTIDMDALSPKGKLHAEQYQILQQSKLKHQLEIEKIDVLLKYYEQTIPKEITVDTAKEEPKDDKQSLWLQQQTYSQTKGQHLQVPLRYSLFDTTGHTGASQIRKSYSSSSASATFTVAFADDRTTGEITISLTPTQTAALEEGRYVYDVELTKTSDSSVTRVIQGIVTVSPNATR